MFKDVEMMKQNEPVCEIPENMIPIEPFVMVIFGGAGDLSKRKLLPTLFHIFLNKKIDCKFSIIGFGRQKELSNETYRDLAFESIKQHAEYDVDESKLHQFCSHLWFCFGNFDHSHDYQKLLNLIINQDIKTNIIYYLSVPGSQFEVIINQIEQNNLNFDKNQARLIIEKPFGHDLESASILNRTIGKVFDEKQIFRIDHYLGKETVQNILFFRFSNSILEPLWNRRYIDNIQVTVAESIGIEGRGRFLEQTGIIRDIVQNHIMQLIALVAMEPPVGFDADYIRDEKIKILKSFRKATPEEIKKKSVIGQYTCGQINCKDFRAYREEDNVPADSVVPTFFCGQFFIDNWRWADTPFYIRTGKRLQRKVTEIVIEFKQPPLKLFKDNCRPLEANFLKITIQPEEKIQMHLGVKYPESVNLIYPINMSFNYTEFFNNKKVPPYERLIVDCLKSDQTLFVRQDSVEACWKIIDPYIQEWESIAADKIPLYQAGTWGPDESEQFLKNKGKRWITE